MKKVVSILLILCMLSAVLAGCGASTSNTDKESNNSVDNTKTVEKTDDKSVTNQDSKAGSEASDPVKDPYGLPNDLSAYPLEGKPTLTYWWPIDSFQAVAIKDMNEHEVWKEIQKITGVNINTPYSRSGK